MLPNSMKVLRRIGIEERLRGFAFAPRSHLNREWDTGEIRAELPMPEALYGAPYLCMHRGDVHDALASLAPSDVKELCAAFDGFHGDVRAALEACPDCHKWAILERDPLPRWSAGRVTLLGDACHPMTPYLAQGAATAIEDAAVLARCLEAMWVEGRGEDVEGAFRRYEANRKPRTSRIQATSSANTWMRTEESATGWLYGYDAWQVPLDAPADA